jgi:hypothetical protein
MENRNLTINSFQKNNSCSCISSPCNCNNGQINKPQLASADDLKKIISKGKDIAKENIKNNDFKKGALAITALVCIYIILK